MRTNGNDGKTSFCIVFVYLVNLLTSAIKNETTQAGTLHEVIKFNDAILKYLICKVVRSRFDRASHFEISWPLC